MWSALAIAIANNHRINTIRTNQVVSEEKLENNKVEDNEAEYEVFCCFIKKKKNIIKK